MILLIILIIACLFSPIRFVAIFGFPSFLILSNAGILPILFEAGSASLRAEDLLFLVTMLKFILVQYQAKKTEFKPEQEEKTSINSLKYINLKNQFNKVLFSFLFILILSSIISFFKYGFEHFLGVTTPLIRLVMQISTLFLVSNFISNKKLDLNSLKYFSYVGYTVYITAYLSFILFTAFGIQFGEVQASLHTTRFFGPLGDQLGFIISFFCFQAFLSSNFLMMILGVFVILFSATRGAIASLALGLILISIYRSRSLKISFRLKYKTAFYIGFSVCMLALIMMSSLGESIFQSVYDVVMTAFNRFTDPRIAQFGIEQRSMSLDLAFQVFMDNFFAGTGYLGFRLLAPNYADYNFFPSYIDPANSVATAQNQYLQVATDAGILGLIIFFYLIFFCFKLFRKATDLSKLPSQKNLFISAQIWLFSLLIGNQGAAWILPSSFISLMLWILLGIASETITHGSRSMEVDL